LERILGECKGQNVIVGTHGMALSTVIHYYDPRFGYGDFARLLPLMPMIVKLTFEGMRCVGIEYHAFADGG
jgi:2,3-bisphosphoglycerate-dependent phosphoglycerate mutase